jgi:hypothetical protein
MSNGLKNFGILIPQKAMDIYEKPDPNGVPIYAKCPSNGLCACTGACRKILGYDTAPDKIAAYHADVERRNNILKEQLMPKNDH